MESVHHFQVRQQNDVTDTILICYYITWTDMDRLSGSIVGCEHVFKQKKCSTLDCILKKSSIK